jgi:hypothetical protein
MPITNDTDSLASIGYNLQYKGSKNKIRNLTDIWENDTELSKFLSRRIIEYRLTENNERESIVDELFHFFKGRNVIEYSRLWEKVFSFLITNNKPKQLIKAITYFTTIIREVKHKDTGWITKKIHSDLLMYLQNSLTVSLALLSKNLEDDEDFRKELTKTSVIRHGVVSQFVFDNAWFVRVANMLHHDYVAWPLMNYTSYQGNLYKFDKISNYEKREIEPGKLLFSPRYIHLDEYQLFRFVNMFSINSKLNEVKKPTEFDQFNYNIHEIYETYKREINSSYGENGNDGIIIIPPPEDETGNYTEWGQSLTTEIIIQNHDIKNETIIFGVANLAVKEDDIKASYIPTRSPNLSLQRKRTISEIINSAICNKRCDLLILPELSIPVAWLPMMVQQSRLNGIGMIFGIEHVVSKDVVWNLVVTTLPFESKTGYRNCLISIRNKNHYSPMENHEFQLMGYSKPVTPKKYDLITWRNCVFSVYNCFELSDISHRSLFRSKVDFVVAIEWNKDTNYFSSIVESCVRDIHAYVIQVNTSQYGDSRISAPLKYEKMNLLRVKGGDNDVLMKKEISFKELREFQIKDYCPSCDDFKPTPPGFDKNEVLQRIVKTHD